MRKVTLIEKNKAGKKTNTLGSPDHSVINRRLQIAQELGIFCKSDLGLFVCLFVLGGGFCFLACFVVRNLAGDNANIPQHSSNCHIFHQ